MIENEDSAMDGCVRGMKMKGSVTGGTYGKGRIIDDFEFPH